MFNVSGRGWDQGFDYEKTKKFLLEQIRQLRGKPGIRARKALGHNAILLTQLRNGSRVSEAVDAVRQWCSTRKKEVEVRVRKHRTDDTRQMVIPEELKEEDRLDISSVASELTVVTAKTYAKRAYKWNTHSLRYARITYLVQRGVAPSIVAKITHHSRLDYVLRYTEQKTADQISRQID